MGNNIFHSEVEYKWGKVKVIRGASQMAPVVKNPPAYAGDINDTSPNPGSGRSSGGGHGNPLWYSCPENPHGQRSSAGYSPQGCIESDTSEVTKHTKVIRDKLAVPNRLLGEGNGNPLQYSCLENPMDGGAW